MEALLLLYILGLIVVGGILVWTYTKSGKEWLKNL